MSSFIYDKISKNIKLTDLGFSQFIKSSQNDINPKIGLEYNEYTPPEIIDNLNNIKSFNDITKFQSAYYDIWQLGILFYKIATFGCSPFNNAKGDKLKECILNKNIDYYQLNKYSAKIVQIIDKMISIVPSLRYSTKALLDLDQFKNLNKAKTLIVNSKDEEKIITMNTLSADKIKNIKVDVSTLHDRMEAEEQKNQPKEQDNLNQKMEKIFGKNFLSSNIIKLHGTFINDKNLLLNREIYPEGSVLPAFKNKYMNKFNNVDTNLIFDLSSKLSVLDKEYKKLDENKIAIYNITNYVNENIKQLNNINYSNIDLLIQKFRNLELSKIETNELYEEMLKTQDIFQIDKFKTLISELAHEIRRLKLELKNEKTNNEKLQKRIKEQEKLNEELNSELNEKIEFYEKKIQLLEEIIFNPKNKNKTKINPEQKNNSNILYEALTTSIKNFTDINIKLKTTLENNLNKFKDNKNTWLEDMINAKKNFRNEMTYYLEKSTETQDKKYFERKSTNIYDKSKEVEELKKERVELKKEKEELSIKNDDLRKQIDELIIKLNESTKEIISYKNKIEELNKKVKLDDKIIN